MVGTRVAHDQVNQFASKSAHATQAYDGRMCELRSDPSEVVVHLGSSLERKHEVVRGAARLRAVSRAAERQRDDERTASHVCVAKFKRWWLHYHPVGQTNDTFAADWGAQASSSFFHCSKNYATLPIVETHREPRGVLFAEWYPTPDRRDRGLTHPV